MMGTTKCPSCGESLPEMEHCVMDKQKGDTFRIQFKRGQSTVLAFELTEFQLRLFTEALIAGGRA